MHLAICDDNIADRKQTERLLGRESDRIFKETGERIYIDSYGNSEAFLSNPQMYHGLFIDMTGDDANGFAILKTLLGINIVRPIIMLCSSLDYRSMALEEKLDAPNVFFLDKPIKVAELRQIVDRIRVLTADVIPTIELRGMEETIYAREEDIICVQQVRSELYVYLTQGRRISLVGDIVNLYSQCFKFTKICPVSDYGLVNVDHVVKTTFGKAHMDNDMVMRVTFPYRTYIAETRQKNS